MGLLTNVFYLISTALLIPCMLALLWCLARALFLTGQALREYGVRRRQRPALLEFCRALEAGQIDPSGLPHEGVLGPLLARLAETADNAAIIRRWMGEGELLWKSDLERFRVLNRNGPAFGLMGTLVPLGPALVGLAAGDLASLSNNLIIAFATTVVGLLVAVIASSLSSIKKRWYQADAILLNFAADRLAQLAAEASSREVPKPSGDGHARASASTIPH